MNSISDPGIRTNSGAPLLTPWSARGMSNDAFAAKSAADTHKDAVAAAVGKAEQAPALSASSNAKSFVSSQIQGLLKRLQILQKLYSSDPKGMAQALTQIFKELRGLLKDYKSAAGHDFAGADAAASSVTMASASGTATATSGDDTQAPTPSDSPQADPAAAAGAVSYAEVDQGLREAIGGDGLTFLDTLRGVLATIDQKMLTPARIQHAAHAPDKDEDKVFKDMDDQRKALDQDMANMQNDIRSAAPTLGLHLAVA